MGSRLENILSYFYRSTRIPVSYYDSTGCIRSYVPVVFQPDIAYCYLEDALEKRTSSVGFVFHHGVHMGYVTVSDEEFLLVGPVGSEAIEYDQCRKLLSDIHTNPGKTKELKYLLSKIPLMNRSRFLCTLQLLNYMIGNEDVQKVEDVSDSDILEEPQEITPQEKEESEFEYHDTQAVEQKLMPIIASGRVNELLEVMTALTNASLSPGRTAGNSLRMTKNTFISAVSIISRIAVHEGVDYDFALTLSDYYIQKVELLTRTEEIVPVLGQMMLDFTSHINELKSFKDVSPITTKAIDYVKRNIHNYCRLENIANALGISVSYLSATFKKDTGIPLKQFIDTEKIRTAKYMLGTPNTSIAEVAEKLKFSSISHFQSSFKKISGTTPGKYRKEKLGNNF